MSLNRAVLRLLILLAIMVGQRAAYAQSEDVLGHWEGTLSFRGADMPVRLEVRTSRDSLRATLDIPSLLMAWEPIPTTRTNEGIELELPFGLGPLNAVPNGDGIRGQKLLGEEALTWHLARAAAPPYTREDVLFQSGGDDLVGTLVLPETRGPVPGVVLLHGSGRQGRSSWMYRSWADLLVREGLAVLYYDKRGVGDSGGDYGAGLAQLATDAMAAVAYLRSRPEVDSRRIGLKGSSQGAWIAEQVASDLGDIAFLLLVSAAAGTPRDQEMQKIEYGMRADGRSEAEIEDAIAYAGLYFYVARTGEGWPLLEEAVMQAQKEDWGQYVDQPTFESDLVWWQENHAFQPAEAVDDLDLPVLLLYGGADWITPPIENADKLKSMFPIRERVEVHVFPNADHRLEVGSGRDAAGNWRWPAIAPGVRDIVSTWLDRQELE